jgi:hypothetical protein
MTMTPDELLEAAIRRAKLTAKPVKEGASFADLVELINPKAGGRWAQAKLDEAQAKATHTSDGQPWRPHHGAADHWANNWPDAGQTSEPLGYSIDQMEAVGTPQEVAASLEKAGASSSPASPTEPATSVSPSDRRGSVGTNSKPLRRI